MSTLIRETFTQKQFDKAAEILGLKTVKNIELDFVGGIWLVTWFHNKYGEKSGFAHKKISTRDYKEFIGRVA